jgi:adenosylhomocysteine nucleosidase
MKTCFPSAFVFATAMEAEPFLALHTVREIAHAPSLIYESDGITHERFLIMISGMGLSAVATSTEHLINNFSPTRIINCGVAGSLSNAFSVGDIFQISAVAEVGRSLDLAAINFLRAPGHLALPLAGRIDDAHLVSLESPVFDVARRTQLGKIAELVDMEGAAIARVCSRHGRPCAMLKVVSDHADDRDTLLRNLTHTSRRLADFISYYLEPLLQPDSYYEAKHPRSA